MDYKVQLVILGEKIRLKRIRLKMSIQELSLIADIHPGTLSNLENGNTSPSLKLLFKIAIVLNEDLRDLF